MRTICLWAAAAVMLAGCGGSDGDGGSIGVVPGTPTPTPPTPTPTTPTPSPPVAPVSAVDRRVVASFDRPWAMTVLPDGRMLVTETPGRLRIVTRDGTVFPAVAGVPSVATVSQGGLLDVALDPAYATNNRVYLSFSEQSGGAQRLAVGRGTLVIGADGSGRLNNFAVIWRQSSNPGGGHFGGRMAFSPDGFLYVTAGERQQGSPAQDNNVTLGKIVRLTIDGGIPADNPLTSGAREIWTSGNRNPYGLVFASDGRLFSSEMGPEGGDEFNLVERGRNYGWPIVSEGNQYGGTPYPRHSTRPDFAAPLVSWTPVIAPAGMIQYRGTRFTGWTDSFVLAGLVSQGLVRVTVSGSTATEAQRLSLGARIREVEEAPDGAIWVLEDGNPGRLIELTPQTP